MACLFFILMALNSEDEDRVYEELLLDLAEPTLHFTLGVSKARFIEHLRRTRQFSHKGGYMSSIHEYFAEDTAYENELIAEIFEFPTSIIRSNNYYFVPLSEKYTFPRILRSCFSSRLALSKTKVPFKL